MEPQSRWRIRWALLVGTWLLVLIPTVTSSQSGTTGQTVTTERIFISGTPGQEVRIVTRGGGPPRRIADMPLPVPGDNPLTDDKVALGRRLFSEPQLSKDGSVSCATCHEPERAFADGRTKAVGVFNRVGKRHSPALINRGFGRMQFWDGRAPTLEAQVLQPIADPNEMDLPVEEAVKRLEADEWYRAAFQTAFGRPLSSADLSRALASFVRSIRSGDSPYDRFVAGATDALSEEQQRGLQIFRTRARCVICHREPLFTDEVFWNTGVAVKTNAPAPGEFRDDGRFGVSRNERERGSFKTPTLREVARTAPYMHDGSFATLADVVDFYDKGGRPSRQLVPLIRPLNLSAEEKRALIAFLESLSGVVTPAPQTARDR